jgi:hypothetical protein
MGGCLRGLTFLGAQFGRNSGPATMPEFGVAPSGVLSGAGSCGTDVPFVRGHACAEAVQYVAFCRSEALKGDSEFFFRELLLLSK